MKWTYRNYSGSTGVFICVLCAFVIAMSAAPKPVPQGSSKPVSGDINRGKYLVEEVAKCAECHTPRDSQGRLDASRWLQGAPTWITPVQPTVNWAYNAPALAGFLSYTDADGVNIFEKGRGPNGAELRPPMHVYHMSHEDTVAIIAYLRSLPSPAR